MFARQEVTLDLSFPASKAQLARLMRGDWLDSVSQDAYTAGLSGQMRVGPFGLVPGMSKLVEVRLLDPVPMTTWWSFRCARRPPGARAGGRSSWKTRP